jgi:hypothetical protein
LDSGTADQYINGDLKCVVPESDGKNAFIVTDEEKKIDTIVLKQPLFPLLLHGPVLRFERPAGRLIKLEIF